MSEYLFNPNLLMLVSMVSVGVWLVFYRKTLRYEPRQRIVLGSIVSLLLFSMQLLLIRSAFGLQDTPTAMYYLVLVCNIFLVFTLVQFGLRHWRKLTYGALSLLCGLILLAITLNNYYRYLPTFQAFFQTATRGPVSTITAVHQHHNYAIVPLESALYSNGFTQGSVTTINIPGTASHLKARSSYVYLPPAYGDAAFKQVRFPLLVLLTGVPGTPSNWLQGGELAATTNEFASHHKGITPIVVIADHSGSFGNDTECVDSPHGNADTYLTSDVPAYMKAHYRILNNPNNWGIAGLSEGGMCAAMLTLKHQNIYRHFLDLSGAPYPYLNNSRLTLPVLFHGSKRAQQTSNINWLLNHQQLDRNLTAQFAIGANDSKRLISEMRQTYSIASSKRIITSYEVISHQGHSYGAWSQGYADALPKLSYYLGATECDSTCTQ